MPKYLLSTYYIHKPNTFPFWDGEIPHFLLLNQYNYHRNIFIASVDMKEGIRELKDDEWVSIFGVNQSSGTVSKASSSFVNLRKEKRKIWHLTTKSLRKI